MAQYDGSIRIGTEISTKEAKKSLGTLSNMITLTAKEISSLRSKMDALKGQKFYTDDYKKLQSDLADAEKKLAEFTSLITDSTKLNEAGQKAVNENIKKYEEAIDSIKEKMQNLETEEKAFTFGSDTAEYANYERQIQNEQAALAEATKQYQAMDKLKDPYGRLSQALTDLNGKLSSILRPIQKIQSAFAQDVKVGGYEKLKSSLGELGGISIRVAETVKNAFATLKQGPVAVIHSLSSSLMNMANTVNSAIGSVLSSGLEKFGESIGVVLEKIRQLVSGIGSGISTAFNVAKEKLAGFAGSVINLILHPFQTLKNVASTTLGGIANIIKGTLGSALEGLKNRAAGVAASIINGIAHPFQTMKSIASKAISGTSKLLSGMASVAKKVGIAIKNAASSMLGFGKSTNKSSGLLSTFGSRFKGLALSLLIFNQISKAFNAMISGIKEGFGNLYKEVDGFKSSVDSLKASALTLKNSLAAAFRPLVEAVIPYIQKAIEYITRLADSFGQLMAAITGQKTYTKAIKQTIAALEDAKEAEEGYLGPLDEINKYKAKDSQSGVDGSSGTMFEENVPIDSKFIEMANRIKEVLAQLFQPLKTAWENQGQFVMDSWKYALEEIGLLAQSVGKDFLEVWNQPETISVLENILIIVGDIGLVVGNLAARFREAWEENDVGLRILENIRNLFGIIIEHVRNAADATVEWSKNLDFSPMLESINGLLEALQPFVDNIGAGLEWFYINVLLPIAGWTIEEAIPTFLDMLSEAIGVVNEVIEALKPLGMWLWEEFLQPLGKWAGDTIIAAMETITDLLKKFGNWVSEHQEAVQNFTIVIGAFAAAWGVVSTAVGIWNGIAAIASTVTTAFGAAITFLTSPIGLVTLAIGALIAGFTLLYKNSESFRNFIDGIVEGAKNLIPGIIEGIKSGWAAFTDWLGGLWQGIVDGFKDFFGIHSPSTLMAELGGYLVMGLIEGIKNLVGKVEEIWESMKQFAENTWNSVKDWMSETWSTIKQTASQKWTEIKQNLSEKWSQMKSDAKEKFDQIRSGIADTWAKTKENTASAWSTIKEKSISASDYVKNGVMNAWNALKTGTANVWESIMNAIKRPINGILGFVESLANGVVNAINTVIRALNRLSFDIPSWIPGIGGNHFGFNIPELSQVSIPRLATGTVVPPNNEFLAVLGDNKREPEVVSPISTMKQAFLEAIAESGGVGSGKPVNITLQVSLDRKVLGQTMVDWGKLQQMATGNNPYALGTT